MKKQLGRYAFTAGIITALVLGLAKLQTGPAESWLWTILIFLGIAVGLTNIAGKETKEFLLLTAALAVIAYTGQAELWEREVQILGPYLRNLFESILAFMVSAAIVAALKSAWAMAKGE